MAFPAPVVAISTSKVRWSLYLDDHDAAHRALLELATLDSMPARLMVKLCGFALGAAPVETGVEAYRALRDLSSNARFASAMLQVSVEMLASGGEPELAIEALLASANRTLIDIEWLGHCKLLDSLRGDPRFAQTKERVARRANDIWRR